LYSSVARFFIKNLFSLARGLTGFESFRATRENAGSLEHGDVDASFQGSANLRA
jgi:hypothetical protein